MMTTKSGLFNVVLIIQVSLAHKFDSYQDKADFLEDGIVFNRFSPELLWLHFNDCPKLMKTSKLS